MTNINHNHRIVPKVDNIKFSVHQQSMTFDIRTCILYNDIKTEMGTSGHMHTHNVHVHTV